VPKSILAESYETLILACTHFPLVEEVFKRSVPEGVEIFDPAEGVAKEVVGHYRGQGSGKLQFLISKDSDFFRAKVAEFFGNSDYTIDVVS
jgi:glutamate racemase